MAGSRRGDAKILCRTPPALGFYLAAASGLWRLGFACLGRNGLRLLLQLFQDTPNLRRVDVDAGAHRARDRHLPDVAALRRGRLRAHDLVDHRHVVLDEGALVEALLADREMDVRAAVGAVLELAGLRVADGLQPTDGLDGRVRRLAVDRAQSCLIALAVVAHRSTSTPIERAVPAMISAAWSTSRAFRSSSFVSAIWRTWSRDRRPTL